MNIEFFLDYISFLLTKFIINHSSNQIQDIMRTFFILILTSLIAMSCDSGKKISVNQNKSMTMTKNQIMEVTTFNVKSEVSQHDFKKRDAEIETDYTSKQPGFIKRISGITEDGEIGVIVHWESMADAQASMSKFMKDTSVADYAEMIDGPTMKMSRYVMDKAFNADDSQFVEVMAFDVKPGTDLAQFKETNYKVETEFTGKREGFLQRLVGTNESGRQVVAVYWNNKKNSDASMQPFMAAPIAKQFMESMDQSTIGMGRYKLLNMELTNTEKVVALLNSFNTGDKTPISYISPEKYIQHNLGAPDGLAGFGEIMKHAPPQGFKANVIRAFEDGDYVFTHTEYDFFGPKAGFDVFRFENGLIVEHWDNLLEVQPANPSGHTQFDGATEVADKDKTATNKKVVRDLLEKVFMGGQMENIATFINPTKYIQHNPNVPDGLEGLGSAMKAMAEQGMMMKYETIHKVLGDGNFVLTLSEGTLGDQHTAYYDLFRLENNQIVEHWDVIAPIPPKSEWKNNNGKF